MSSILYIWLIYIHFDTPCILARAQTLIHMERKLFCVTVPKNINMENINTCELRCTETSLFETEIQSDISTIHSQKAYNQQSAGH